VSGTPGHLEQQALAAARDLTSGESALAGVLRDLEQERSRAAQAYHAVLRSLAAALEARDGYTGEHSDDVGRLSGLVAARLGLDDRHVAEVEAVALLHDIGKIGVPDAVLHKPGRLTPGEWDLMREHPVIGERILRPLPGLDAIATAVRHEHERWDGSGYPDGLAGAAIPLASRIVLACDAYHALVTDRPYRAALGEEPARDELRRCAGTQFDPAVIDALLTVLSDDAPEGAADAEQVAAALTAPGSDEQRRELEGELLALIRIAGVVSVAARTEDVVEEAAEHAREAIGASSLSISKWEVAGRVLRTIVNVGELGPDEQRNPSDERYRLGEDDPLRLSLERGEAFVMTLDDPNAHPLERRLLERAGRFACAGVGIRWAGKPWGELWATRRADQDPFDERDLRFLQTVAGLIATAAGRAEVFARMSELAYQDPLTGVANRRALEERLEEAVAAALKAGTDVAVMLCDVDGLKELNDVSGHQAGDAALARVAAVLTEAAGDGLVARIGGDEFCVLLEGASADDARRVGEQLLERLGADDTALSASCGVASLGTGSTKPGELLRAADAAQYTAKRGGRGRVIVSDDSAHAAWTERQAERRAIRGLRSVDADTGALVADALSELDGAFATRPVLDRLEVVALAAGDAVDASGVAVSRRDPASPQIETTFVLDRRSDVSAGSRGGLSEDGFAAADYPTTAAAMAASRTFWATVDDPATDPTEAALLREYGFQAVLGAGRAGAGGGDQFLVEIFGDARTASLESIEGALRLLVAEAVRV
jgi:diguanylate cyclase (GGDEF)-like protein